MDRIGDWSQAELRRFIVNQILGDPGALPATLATKANLQAGILAATGRLMRIDHILTGTSYTVPVGATSLYIECVGGGGGGGGGSGVGVGNVAAGGGGGGGAYAAVWITANIGEHTVAIGAGGTTGVAVNGTAGGDTSFADSRGTTICLAKGGLGGDNSGAVTVARAVSQGGDGGPSGTCIGDLRVPGGAGGQGVIVTTSSINVGSCGGDAGGIGGGGARHTYGSGDLDGNAALGNSGGGGSGALVNSGAFGRSGGTGGSGFIRVWVFS